jgi:Uma2 family endonuclease
MIAILENPDIRELAQPLSVAGYHLLRDCGALETKTELIQGVVTNKMTKTPWHEYLIARLIEELETDMPSGYFVRKEGPLTLADSEPEPDISIVKGQPRDYRHTHPTRAELVVEVAVSSLSLDLTKARVYAAAGIPHYWIVDAHARGIEVFGSPRPVGYQNRCIQRDSIQSPFGREIDLHSLFAE